MISPKINSQNLFFFFLLTTVTLLIVVIYQHLQLTKNKEELSKNETILKKYDSTSLAQNIYNRRYSECVNLAPYEGKKAKDCDELNKVEIFIDEDLNAYFGKGRKYEE